MQLILIRHAQSKGNEANIVQGQTDEGLSGLGTEQAKKLSDYFQIGDITAIYSSDLGRAMQTAEPTAKKLGLKITVDAKLREAHFGIWEGLTFSEVKEKFPDEYTKWHKNYFIRPQWFESYESHRSRIQKAIENILPENGYDSKIAIFTHGGSIKTQLGYFKNLSGKDLTEYKTMNCSLTLINFNPTIKYEDGKLIYYNKEVI